MFGSYNCPVSIEKENLLISLETEGDVKYYRRECLDNEVEKIVLNGNGNILFNPVEPVNLPKEITSYLLIEFERSFMVEPGTTRKIYIKFPVEVGVFISAKKKYEVIDVFTMVNQKFILYGDPRSGIICKYWLSDVYFSLPSADPMLEGVIELEIMNTTIHWAELTRVVFNAYAMKIYYGDDIVSMKAKMKIMAGEIAETDFVNSPINKGMKKSVELYTTRRVVALGTKFLMEKGL
ncbi:MAG: DUF432 domain-containing protein [Methanosarcinaceae archaeon]|nr:DUF432 domain-containing protein [Methanosarcinaceae archaeon]